MCLFTSDMTEILGSETVSRYIWSDSVLAIFFFALESHTSIELGIVKPQVELVMDECVKCADLVLFSDDISFVVILEG